MKTIEQEFKEKYILDTADMMQELIRRGCSVREASSEIQRMVDEIWQEQKIRIARYQTTTVV